MTEEERKLTIEYLEEMKEKYIEGEGYERHPLPEWYALDKAIEALEQDSILDKIKAEIEALPKTYPFVNHFDMYVKVIDVTKIIDKYKAADELRMEKHTDRQIYDGCILLMQKMVDYFQGYLEYLGYDLDKLDEDERFVVRMSNMEIVRQLFLQNTRNSGGCSTRDFCEKLGVDTYKSVKFEFDWYEEE